MSISSTRNIIGINPVLEALKSDAPIEKIYISKTKYNQSITNIIKICKNKAIPLHYVENNILSKLSESSSHQGVLAVTGEIAYCSVDDLLLYAAEKKERPFLLILDEITDPHNFGAIIRSAEGCGCHGIIIPSRNSAPINSVVSKTSAGALESIKIAKVKNIADTVDYLKSQNIWVFGTSDSEQSSMYSSDFTVSLAIIVGNEGKGIRKLIQNKCDKLVSIPMFGKVSSLNVSVASAIIMYEVVRQRLYAV